MSDKLHCMVDIETLATCPNAAIIQIGGCKFDINSDLITEEFCINVSPQSSRAAGLVVDPDTIKWWQKQDKEVIKSLQTDQVSLADALHELHRWYKKENDVIWAWGSSFDAPILESAFIACGLKQPWKYWKFQCARTIANVFNIDKERGSGSHNAQFDAIDQAKLIQKFYSAMNG